VSYLSNKNRSRDPDFRSTPKILLLLSICLRG